MNTEDSTAMSAETAGDDTAELDLLRRQVDAIQISLAAKATPWYRNPSTVLSVAALLFSFGTTAVSYLRTESQDIQNARTELRTLLQRLAALPREGVETAKKYETDPATATSLGGFIGQENTILARQAAEIANRIPARYVSATEYYAVGVALQNAYNVDGAKAFFTKALSVSKDFSDEVAALRTRGNLLFLSGQPEAGRKDYQDALDIFRGPRELSYNDYVKKNTHVITQLSWAYSELGLNARDSAMQHVNAAESYLSGLPPSPGLEQMKAQIGQTRALIAGGMQQPQSIGAGLPPGIQSGR